MQLFLVVLVSCVPWILAGFGVPKSTSRLYVKTTVSLAIKRFHWAWPTVEVNSTLEDEYMKHFGNDTNPTDLRDGLEEWHAVRACNSERGMEILKVYCGAIHAAAGRGNNITVNGLLLRPRKLIFKNYNYEPRRIDTLSYGVEGVTDVKAQPTSWYLIEGAHGYLTKGRRPDCVYYLTLLSSNQQKYVIKQEICGIDPPPC